MKKILVVVLMVLLGACFAPTANADTCNTPGYYLNENNECIACKIADPFYCPGDGSTVQCPTASFDYYQQIANDTFGQATIIIEEPGIFGYSASDFASYDHCYLDIWVEIAQGKFLNECNYAPSRAYWCPDNGLWYEAKTGYYLSGYNWTSFYDWYYRVKACTNAPANAHYTGAGTPDSTDGTIVDANDCPWACDDGYYGSSVAGSNSCTLCEAGNSCTGGVKTPCSAGTYSGAGAASCTACPTATTYASRVTGYGYWTEDGIHNTVDGCRATILEQDPTGDYTLSCGYINGDYGVNCPSSGDCCMAGGVTSCAAGRYSPWPDPDANVQWSPSVSAMEGTVCIPCATGYDSPDGALTCTPNTVTISWDDGDNNPANNPTTQCTYDGGISTPTTIPTKRGHVFNGWKFVE